MLSDLVFDRATIRHKLIEFKIRWRGHIDQWKAENRPATESSHDQQFWGDLLACFGVNTRDLYLYQRSAKRASTGHAGKIDMFIPGKVIGEAKSLGIDLDKAHEQALDYLLGGTIPNSQMPAYVLCSNFETLRITRLNREYVGDSAEWDVTFDLDEIEVLLQLGAGAKKAPFLLCDQRYVPVLSGRLEYPANNHCIRIRVTIGKHRALPLPQ